MDKKGGADSSAIKGKAHPTCSSHLKVTQKNQYGRVGRKTKNIVSALNNTLAFY